MDRANDDLLSSLICGSLLRQNYFKNAFINLRPHEGAQIHLAGGDVKT